MAHSQACVTSHSTFHIIFEHRCCRITISGQVGEHGVIDTCLELDISIDDRVSAARFFKVSQADLDIVWACFQINRSSKFTEFECFQQTNCVIDQHIHRQFVVF